MQDGADDYEAARTTSGGHILDSTLEEQEASRATPSISGGNYAAELEGCALRGAFARAHI